MRVSLISGLHITAHDKRMIVAGIKNQWEHVQSPRRAVSLREIGENEFEARFSWNESDDWGRPVNRRKTVTVRVH